MVVSSKKRVHFCMILILLNVAFIWGNSLLPAEISAAFSSYVKRLILFLVPEDGPPAVAGTGLLRKIAHVLEFTCLGALWCWYMLMGRRKAYVAYLPAGCVACIDETIQCFVPGRGPRVTDVVIDLGGVTLGIGALLLIQYFKSKKRRNKS